MIGMVPNPKHYSVFSVNIIRLLPSFRSFNLEILQSYSIIILWSYMSWETKRMPFPSSSFSFFAPHPPSPSIPLNKLTFSESGPSQHPACCILSSFSSHRWDKSFSTMRLLLLLLLFSTAFSIDPFELIYGFKDTVFSKVDKVKNCFRLLQTMCSSL